VTLVADIDPQRLTVALDVRHPFAYLALHPTLELVRSMAVPVDWLPLDVPALNPPSVPADGDDRGVRHRRFRAQAIAREIETYSAAQGITIREPYRSGEVEAARSGWLYMRDRHPERLVDYLVALFGGYWSRDVDVSRIVEIMELVARAGGDASAFARWQESDGPPASAALASELRALGIFQVPAYLLDGEVFYGRQHLPMLRWILEGRPGDGPI
jgi:2-hydroxychromene-2-carboxylate isomerase